jgi:hypothetical protein
MRLMNENNVNQNHRERKEINLQQPKFNADLHRRDLLFKFLRVCHKFSKSDICQRVFC